MHGRAGYEDYRLFASKQHNRCRVCGTELDIGVDVLGKRLDARWDIVCVPCGTEVAHAPKDRLRPIATRPGAPAGPAPSAGAHRACGDMGGTPWSKLVRYLRLCVERESALEPIPLNERDRWRVLPLRQESVLCGSDPTVPLLPQIQELIADLDEMEAVFYGWPTVVVTDERHRPFVAPLFFRRLEPASQPAGAIPLADLLPQVNMGLISSTWFSPDLVAAAVKTLAVGAVGFGQPAALTATALAPLTALGLPVSQLDPGALLDLLTLEDPWRPQEIGVFNLVMAGRAVFDDDAKRSLIQDLEWMERASDWRAGAARLLFETIDAPLLSLPNSCAVELNDSQERSLAAANRAPLTVITGPPGTGKSQTVVGIVADAWMRGETVLLASTNNSPIDSVVEDKMAAVDPALMLRTGNVKVRAQLAAKLRDLVSGIQRPDPGEPPPLAPLTLAYHQAARELGERARAERDVLTAAERRDRAQAVVWGRESVPPDVARDRLAARARRALRTRWGWLRRRRSRACLDMAGISDPGVTIAQLVEWATAEDEFESAWRSLQAFLRDYPGQPLERFRAASDAWRAASTASVRARVRNGYLEGASVLAELADALSDGGSRRELIGQAARYVMGWATSALSTRPNFDCIAGSIDLVIIDEASQCSLAQVLPLVYRAKRLVIVGDPAQLTPVVTVPADELRGLAVQAGLDHETLVASHLTYGRDSAFSTFAARLRSGPQLLKEHYRCHPAIIQFCNQQFYRGQLVVLSPVDRVDGRKHGLEWYEVVGRTESGRDRSPINHAEPEAVARWVDGSDLPVEDIGVVTPFRGQANLIKRLLASGAYAAVQVGTAHTFQGGERDTVLFSTVLSTDCLDGTAAWVESERNLINVAVSRARRHLVVFGNRAELKRLRATTLLALADAASIYRDRAKAPLSAAARRLYEALLWHGLPARTGEMDEGYPIAMALDDIGGGRIDVEVSEFPNGDPRGAIQRQLDVRDANVRRLGWKVVRVPGWRAYLEPAAVAVELLHIVTDQVSAPPAAVRSSRIRTHLLEPQGQHGRQT